MIGQDPATNLFGSLSALLRATRAAATRNSRAMGTSGTPLGLLKTLRDGDARPSDLAAALRIGPSVVSRALIPLEQGGLVERASDPADARATLIRLTDLGRARLEALQQVYVDQIRGQLADWSDAEVEQAAGILRRLEQAIAQPADPAAHQRLFASIAVPLDGGAAATAAPPGGATATPTTTRQT